MNKESILNEAAELYAETIKIRNYLHEHPELSFHEENTSAFVAERLKEIGIPIRTGFAKYGIVGLIECGNPGKTVALRADMDALPIEEDASHVPCSKNKGVMHACGHDLHTASLLTTAKILFRHRNELKGRILLIFQPGEETWPGGASLMIKEGALKAFGCEPDVAIGAHVLPEMAVGHAGFHSGTYMASGDEIHLHVHGHGGHGGMPHLLTDNVLIACETIVAMQHLVAREVPATVPMVLSFGKFQADGATNVIPDTVYMAGTMRTMNEEWRAKMKQRITTVAQSIAQAYGANTEVEIRHGYPSVFNNPDLTTKATALTADLLGPENAEQMPLRMTAEDFGFYTQLYPSVFYRFGVCRNDGSPTGSLHTSAFNPDESALRISPAIMAWLAINCL